MTRGHERTWGGQAESKRPKRTFSNEFQYGAWGSWQNLTERNRQKHFKNTGTLVQRGIDKRSRGGSVGKKQVRNWGNINRGQTVLRVVISSSADVLPPKATHQRGEKGKEL